MAYYNAKVQQSVLIDKLVDLLTTAPVGSGEPYWKKVSSGNFESEGYILHSSGKSGTDDIFVRFIKGGSSNNVFNMSVMKNYVPSNTGGLDGVITDQSASISVIYHNAAYNGTFPVEYFLSFDRDKIMLAVRGDKSVNNVQVTCLVWAGMPDRLAPNEDTGNGAVTIACSRAANTLGYGNNSSYVQHSKCPSLENRNGIKYAPTDMKISGSSIGRSKGWGGDILLPNIYLEDTNYVEGVRSIMSGVHPIFHVPTNPDFKEGDEIIKNSKRYIVFQVAYDGVSNQYFASNCFPSAWMAMEQLL